jgi:hypothetical protein
MTVRKTRKSASKPSTPPTARRKQPYQPESSTLELTFKVQLPSRQAAKAKAFALLIFRKAWKAVMIVLFTFALTFVERILGGLTVCSSDRLHTLALNHQFSVRREERKLGIFCSRPKPDLATVTKHNSDLTSQHVTN